MLLSKVGPKGDPLGVLEETRLELGLPPLVDISPLVPLALCRMGVPPEEVGRHLTWTEFEKFSAGLLRSGGFVVEENVRLRGPRAQIDLIARSSRLILSIDCKHWARLRSSGLRAAARAQLLRGQLLRGKLPNEPRPIVSVILTLSDFGQRFIEGVSVVPLLSLRSFLTSVESFTEMIAMV